MPASAGSQRRRAVKPLVILTVLCNMIESLQMEYDTPIQGSRYSASAISLAEIERFSLVVTTPNAPPPHEDCLSGNSSRRSARFHRL